MMKKHLIFWVIFGIL